MDYNTATKRRDRLAQEVIRLETESNMLFKNLGLDPDTTPDEVQSYLEELSAAEQELEGQRATLGEDIEASLSALEEELGV